MAKKPKKITTKKLDDLWAEVVKLDGKCEYCNKTDTLNAHHIFSRSNFATRWDTDNGICLCVAHHVFGSFSAHKAPLEFADWIKEERGQKWYNDLLRKKNQVIRKIDKEAIYNKLIEQRDCLLRKEAEL